MSRIISSTTQSPSILIVQGAYEQYCAPLEVDTVFEVRAFNWVSSVEPSYLSTAQELWFQFQALTVAWRQQRGVMSSITEAAMCPAYQSIIGMGDVAIPFIIATLQSEGDDPDQWFWALRAISGVDPVRDSDRGDYRAMAQSWIEWAKMNGYAR